MDSCELGQYPGMFSFSNCVRGSVIHSFLQAYDEKTTVSNHVSPLTLHKQSCRIFSPFMDKCKRKFSPDTDILLNQNSTRKIFQTELAGS